MNITGSSWVSNYFLKIKIHENNVLLAWACFLYVFVENRFGLKHDETTVPTNVYQCQSSLMAIGRNLTFSKHKERWKELAQRLSKHPPFWFFKGKHLEICVCILFGYPRNCLKYICSRFPKILSYYHLLQSYLDQRVFFSGSAWWLN